MDQANRLYLNNGTADPFNGVIGSDISTDAHTTYSIALGDVDGDGDLDLVAGNYNQTNRLYLNNGTADPFNGVIGTDISADAHIPLDCAGGRGRGRRPGPGGREWQSTNRLYLNNGTADPFNGVTGTDISSDAHNTWSIALGDVDGDGDLDLVAGNNLSSQPAVPEQWQPDPFNGVTGSDISGDAHYTTPRWRWVTWMETATWTWWPETMINPTGCT